ncbi:putative secretory vesicle transport protein [Suhomyces tanzawaensis NRRL Y-17324]|uniref:Putative secretory vesicle transport protein n=1 Tax=Suhomyces tanzawaensis NRRL Y-17324 TaxID=984487 RepID=A0A1E4SF09_9ASCO|nr:putative secretory vesicle transport protein [Suhomyces tanzawaensis NRRL Y-17324]ODV78119.1 putative secretory vesicle transport protein [Suhomyces tanzawaensis NRRL Y-17324]
MSYAKLDLLQGQVYELLEELLTVNQGSSIDEVKLEQSKITRRVNDILVQYKEYLTILKNRLKRGGRDQLAEFELYESKLSSLKIKVRSLQIQANDLNIEAEHKRTLEKYGLNKRQDKQSLENARDELFGDRSSSKKEESNASTDQQILSHNKKITSSLQATRELMSSTVLQSELNLDSLDQQTKDLHKLNEDYVRFADLLNKSKQIVKFIEKQDKSDRNRIYLSLGFFMFCCAWVIWRRVLRTPVRILLWSFFKVFRIFNWIFGTTQVAEASPSSTVSEIASTVLTASIEMISSVDFDKEFVMDLDVTQAIQTTTQLLMDEL